MRGYNLFYIFENLKKVKSINDTWLWTYFYDEYIWCKR